MSRVSVKVDIPFGAILENILRPRLNAQAGSIRSEIVELLQEAGIGQDDPNFLSHRILGVFNRALTKASQPERPLLSEMLVFGAECGMEKPAASMEPDRFCIDDPDEVSKKGGDKP